jgi:hypothetical protein
MSFLDPGILLDPIGRHEYNEYQPLVSKKSAALTGRE